MSDTTPIPPASERERFEAATARIRKAIDLAERSPKINRAHVLGRALDDHLVAVLEALSHPSTPQGWKQIGWTCGEGDCGRIHESPGAEGSYAVPVYVQCPPEQGGKG